MISLCTAVVAGMAGGALYQFCSTDPKVKNFFMRAKAKLHLNWENAREAVSEKLNG